MLNRHRHRLETEDKFQKCLISSHIHWNCFVRHSQKKEVNANREKKETRMRDLKLLPGPSMSKLFLFREIF